MAEDLSRSVLFDGAGNPLRVILASASPRRRDLLARLGLDVEIRPADVDETPLPEEAPVETALRLAIAKADAVEVHNGEIAIAADTIVCIDGAGLGKPQDSSDAVRMLGRLSGRDHEVVTGVAVRTATSEASTTEHTEVRFRTMTAEEIESYVETGEPMGKAGAYAIQGRAGMFVTGIVGSDTNVIGLPLAATMSLLSKVDARIGTPGLASDVSSP